jgi:hypothetical protein
MRDPLPHFTVKQAIAATIIMTAACGLLLAFVSVAFGGPFVTGLIGVSLMLYLYYKSKKTLKPISSGEAKKL